MSAAGPGDDGYEPGPRRSFLVVQPQPKLSSKDVEALFCVDMNRYAAGTRWCMPLQQRDLGARLGMEICRAEAE